MNIRNFAIIAHIDHGKSTLADRFLELTKTVEARKMQEQYLDTMPLERERGITIQMQPVRMIYHPDRAMSNWQLAIGKSSGGKSPIANRQSQPDSEVILNLVDTPGHADFSYEVSRALAAVEGAVLLVDATKGVQAQTVAHFSIARKLGLAIIPVLNKIDSPLARPGETAQEVRELLGDPGAELLQISAKEGTGVAELLRQVQERVPPPGGGEDKPLRALIFGSSYDPYKGVIAYVRVFEGRMQAGNQLVFLGTKASEEAKEVGYFLPHMAAAKELQAGEIGYVATGLKNPEDVRTGDTVTAIGNWQLAIGKSAGGKSPIAHRQMSAVEALPGFEIPRPVVFLSLYPEDASDFDALKAALGKLKLNDPSLSFEAEAKEALGRGFRCGFLGILHSEIVAERLRREFGLSIVISRPSVEFWIEKTNGQEFAARTPADWPAAPKTASRGGPDPGQVARVWEPWARLEVITPTEFLSQVMQLLEKAEAENAHVSALGEKTVRLVAQAPLRAVMADLYDKLKSCSRGMASMDYEVAGRREADVTRLEIWIAGRPEETLSAIVPKSRAYQEGKTMVEKLKEYLPAQQFAVPLQAVSEGRIIARETIRARRRDVTAPLYGGDVTRKKKLLERQKKGKKELAERGSGSVRVPPDVLLKVYRAAA